jgi:hypothetical protein
MTTSLLRLLEEEMGSYRNAFYNHYLLVDRPHLQDQGYCSWVTTPTRSPSKEDTEGSFKINVFLVED